MQNKITCTRRLTFESGHRLYGHESKCANLHGHSYRAFFTAEAPSLDQIGRIVDFSVLKEKLGGWIDLHWDHAFLYFTGDLECKQLFEQTESFIAQKSYRCSFNPSAENIANFLLKQVAPRVLTGTDVVVTKVVLWETENCFAEASL